MDQAEVRELVRQREERVVRSTVAQAAEAHPYVRPFAAAAIELIDLLTDESPRFMFGLPELDEPLQGVARGELCYLTGRAYSGKTQLVLNALVNAPQTRMLWFTPDETDAKILSQLVALIYDIDPQRLGERLKAKDPAAYNLCYYVTQRLIPNLIVIPHGLTFPEMTDVLHYAEEKVWEAPCEAVLIDYLDLLPGGNDFLGTKSKSIGLKAWTKRNAVPMVAIHQPRRGGAERGTTIGMDDMNMAGDTEATHVLGVHRKKDKPRASLEDTWMHRNTITVSISKNKHPPCTQGEFDFYMHPTSGRIRPLRPEDMVQPGQAIESARLAIAASRQQRPVNTDRVISLESRRLDLA